MESQKLINLLDKTQNQPSKVRTRNWVEVNDKASRNYNVENQIKLNYTIPKPNLCDYKDA